MWIVATEEDTQAGAAKVKVCIEEWVAKNPAYRVADVYDYFKKNPRNTICQAHQDIGVSEATVKRALQRIRLAGYPSPKWIRPASFRHRGGNRRYITLAQEDDILTRVERGDELVSEIARCYGVKPRSVSAICARARMRRGDKL